MPSPSIDAPRFLLNVVIIGWQGFGEKAQHIAEGLAQAPDVLLRVIYSNAAEADETGPGEWIKVPNSHYFGLKFRRAVADFQGDALVIIQADAACDDWPQLLQRCRQAFAANAALGIWAPKIDYTPWTPERVDIRPDPSGSMTHVAHTDGIVTAFSSAVVRRLQALNYDDNNIGWGIDWIAICHCYTQGLQVMRDDGLLVLHPPSRGYDTRQATRQWLEFMGQMSAAEQSMFEILKRYTHEKKKGPLAKLKASIRRRLNRR